MFIATEINAQAVSTPFRLLGAHPEAAPSPRNTLFREKRVCAAAAAIAAAAALASPVAATRAAALATPRTPEAEASAAAVAATPRGSFRAYKVQKKLRDIT